MSSKFQKEIKRFFEEEVSSCYPDRIIAKKDGTVAVRKTYFYRHGQTAQTWGQKVTVALGDKAHLIEISDNWKDWPKLSYFEAVVKQA